MGKGSRTPKLVQEAEPAGLWQLIHERVRVGIEQIVREELDAAPGAAPYERVDVRHGCRNGSRHRTLGGPMACSS